MNIVNGVTTHFYIDIFIFYSNPYLYDGFWVYIFFFLFNFVTFRSAIFILKVDVQLRPCNIRKFTRCSHKNVSLFVQIENVFENSQMKYNVQLPIAISQMVCYDNYRSRLSNTEHGIRQPENWSSDTCADYYERQMTFCQHPVNWDGERV